MSYFTDARDQALAGLGFGSGDDAAKTAGTLIRQNFGGFTPTLATPAPAAPAPLLEVPQAVTTAFNKTIFGVKASTFAIAGLSLVGVGIAYTFLKRMR